MKICFNGLALLILIPILSLSCNEKTDKASTFTTDSHGSEKMISELNELVEKGDPKVYYHWNAKRAEDLRALMNTAGEDKSRLWFQMINEALNAGQTNFVIQEVHQFAQQFGGLTAENLTPTSKPLYEMMALAQLRLGEQENCQENHTPKSCILPLDPVAVHRKPKGSTNAIALYTMLLDKFPNEWKYKWLLNLAYMTLGQHPGDVPEKYLIAFPNTDREASGFSVFNNIAEYIGLAENGLSGGVCTEDFNGDGLVDILASSYGMSHQIKLFINHKNGQFTDATADSGLNGIVSGLNTIHADYDNDGDRDVLVLRGAWLTQGGRHPNSLLRNNGNGTFTDITESAGLLSRHPTQTASWADYDGDGWLDLFIGNESTPDDVHLSELYKNNGNGTFTNVIKGSGITPDLGYVKGAVWGDINNDGKPDLYLSVLGKPNKLYQNLGDRFIDITEKAGVDKPIYSFPTWFFDFDNDGFEDLFVCSYDNRKINDVAGQYARELVTGKHESERPRLYRNNGNNTFTEVGVGHGLNVSMFGMGSNFGDLDNDGFLDFYIGTGAPDLSSVVPNRMFRNLNGKGFEEVTSAGGFGHIQKGHGTAFFDYDNDGDQDVYAVMGGAFEGDFFSNVLFQNPGHGNGWITVELIGKNNNRDGIGARIKVVTNQGNIYRTVNTGGSFGSATLRQEIGLGKANAIESIEVRWPDGARQKFMNVGIGQMIRIEEGNDAVIPVDLPVIPFKIPS